MAVESQYGDGEDHEINSSDSWDSRVHRLKAGRWIAKAIGKSNLRAALLDRNRQWKRSGDSRLQQGQGRWYRP
jgi:hypothetical protein